MMVVQLRLSPRMFIVLGSWKCTRESSCNFASQLKRDIPNQAASSPSHLWSILRASRICTWHSRSACCIRGCAVDVRLALMAGLAGAWRMVLAAVTTAGGQQGGQCQRNRPPGLTAACGVHVPACPAPGVAPQIQLQGTVYC